MHRGYRTVVDLLSILGGLIAIGGVAGKLFGNTTFMGPLLTPVPLWVLLAGLLLAPTLTLLAARHRIPPADDENQAPTDAAQAELEGRLRDCVNQLGTEQAKLDEYEGIENQILGLLTSGEEISLDDLFRKLALPRSSEGSKTLNVAVASLKQKDKIVGTGPTLPKLKLK